MRTERAREKVEEPALSAVILKPPLPLFRAQLVLSWVSTYLLTYWEVVTELQWLSESSHTLP